MDGETRGAEGVPSCLGQQQATPARPRTALLPVARVTPARGHSVLPTALAVGTLWVVPISQTGKQRHREVKELVQTSGQRQSQGLSPRGCSPGVHGGYTSMPTLLSPVGPLERAAPPAQPACHGPLTARTRQTPAEARSLLIVLPWLTAAWAVFCGGRNVSLRAASGHRRGCSHGHL